MPWWLFCLIPAFLWGLNNLVDQHVARKYFKNDAKGFQATTGIFSFISGLIVVSYSTTLYPVSLADSLAFIGLGILVNLSFVPYLKALQIDEASTVIPLFQLIPVFIFFLSWFFLGETLSTQQLIAAICIIIASMGVTYDFKQIQLKTKTLLLMALSSLGVAIFTVLSRYYVQETHWLPVAGYVMVGAGVFSCLVFFTNKNSLKNSIALFKKNRINILSFFILVELLSRGAMLCYQKALSIAPATVLVQIITGGLQPFIIFFLTIFFAILTPATVAKIEFDRVFVFHLLCVTIMSIGLYCLLTQ